MTIAIGICILVGVIIGFGIFEAVTFSNGKALTPSGQACPSFPANLTYFEATKIYLDQYHWTYEFENQNFSGSIQAMCPSTTYDVNVFIGSDLAIRSDATIFSTISTTYINDCHGNTLYVTRTGNAFQTFVNSFQITVTLELRQSVNSPVLGYINGTDWFANNLTMYDINGNPVANLYRDTFSLSWVWKITVYNTSHPGGDPRVLAFIAGNQAFTESNGNTDICNSMFWGLAWTFLTIGIIIVLMIAAGIYKACKKD